MKKSPAERPRTKEILFSQLNGLFRLIKPILPYLLFAVLIIFFAGPLMDRIVGSDASYGPPPLKGMALGLFHKEPSYDYKKDLQEIQSLGANAILLMIPWYQKDIRSNRMEPRYDPTQENSTPSKELLKEIIRESHRLKMKVILMPYLRFDYRGAKDWRGVLAPTNFELWLKNYYQFILQFAQFAEENKVEYFSIGSELGSLEVKKEFWKNLIRLVRERYTGQLTYSSNWDHFTHPTFWKELDLIGITAYNRLSNKPAPSLPELKKSWKKNKKKISKFLKKYPEKKIIFTEIGYPSMDGASKDPWNYFAKGKTDLEEQALCYRAFIETWDGVPYLEGVFWWVWYDKGGANDNSYTPRGKPAAALLRTWYQGQFKRETD